MNKHRETPAQIRRRTQRGCLIVRQVSERHRHALGCDLHLDAVPVGQASERTGLVTAFVWDYLAGWPRLYIPGCSPQRHVTSQHNQMMYINMGSAVVLTVTLCLWGRPLSALALVTALVVSSLAGQLRLYIPEGTLQASRRSEHNQMLYIDMGLL